MNVHSLGKLAFFLFFMITATILPALSESKQIEFLPARYSDNMVIQKGRDLLISFECQQEGEAYVFFKNKKYIAQTSQGMFHSTIPKQNSYGGPYELTVTIGSRNQTVKNVWVGEVIYYSGQSNMQFAYKDLRPEMPETPRSRQHVSFFNVQTEGNQTEWELPDEQSIPTSGALAVLSAIDISNKTNIPIGVIISAVGGSRIEEWFPPSFDHNLKLLHKETFNNIAEGKNSMRMFTSNKTFINNYSIGKETIEKYQNIEQFTSILTKHQNELEKQFPFIKYSYTVTPKKHHFEFDQMFTSKLGIPYIRAANTLERTNNYPFNNMVWYQGESNCDTLSDALTYRYLLEDFIKGIWMSQNAVIPILIIQLPEFKFQTNDDYSLWSYIREAQSNVAASTPELQLVPALGTGNKDTVHPPDKRELAKRISAQVQHTLTGQPSITPQINKIEVIQGSLRITFQTPLKV